MLRCRFSPQNETTSSVGFTLDKYGTLYFNASYGAGLGTKVSFGGGFILSQNFVNYRGALAGLTTYGEVTAGIGYANLSGSIPVGGPPTTLDVGIAGGADVSAGEGATIPLRTFPGASALFCK